MGWIEADPRLESQGSAPLQKFLGLCVMTKSFICCHLTLICPS